MFISELFLLGLFVLIIIDMIMGAFAEERHIMKFIGSFVIIAIIAIIVIIVTAWTRAEIRDSLIKNNKIEYKVTKDGDTYLFSEDSSFNEIIDMLEFGYRREYNDKWNIRTT